MKDFIPYNKMSKKKQREFNRSKRSVWLISPVTRRAENPKAYNRRKALQNSDDSGSAFYNLTYSCIFTDHYGKIS